MHVATALLPGRLWTLKSSFCLFRSDQAVDRRERLRRLALETIDLAKDPYYFRNHLGQVRLTCCTSRCITALDEHAAQEVVGAGGSNEKLCMALTLLPPSLVPTLLQIECRLCHTLHTNEGNYLAHTQGKRHQQNLAKRAAREAAEQEIAPAPQRRVAIRKTVKIGRPGYRVTKEFDPELGARALLFQVQGSLRAQALREI